MPPIRISDVMRAEHMRLTRMLMNVISLADKNSPDLYKKFIEFKWNVEKHFFVEEKAIFAVYTSKVDTGKREVNLISEHKEMTLILNQNEKLLDGGKKLQLSEFKKIILNHQAIEDEYFYAGLESSINEDLKAEIVNKTLEIIKA